jgi:hypothetical protein
MVREIGFGEESSEELNETLDARYASVPGAERARAKLLRKPTPAS